MAETAPPLFISLGSFGASQVRRLGQAHFVRLAEAAGADGVEVRGELLAHEGQGAAAHAELAAIADAAARLQRVYSSPEGLWDAHGALDEAALARALDAAARLQAPRLKMSIGGWRPGGDDALPRLGDRLHSARVALVIENDQTAGAGTLPALARFFERVHGSGLPLGMTFDMGNWHWLGECPQQAACALGTRVVYVHCKGVQRLPHKWVAVPLAESAAPWRAVLRALPAGLPWAVEYPLQGDDLLAVTRGELDFLRGLAGSLAS